MARHNNPQPFGSGFNITASTPIDSRMQVDYLADLTDATQWPSDTAPMYKGMSVLVLENGSRYTLITDPSQITTLSMSDWKFEGAQTVVTDTDSTTPTIALVAENTLYKYTQPLTSLTITDVTVSTLESEIQFTAGSTGFNISLPVDTGTTALKYPLIGSIAVGANQKCYISIKNGVIVIYSETMSVDVEMVDPYKDHLVTSKAVATWVSAQIEEATRDAHADYGYSDSTDTQYIYNKPSVLGGVTPTGKTPDENTEAYEEGETIPDVSVIATPANGTTGYLNADGTFKDVSELPEIPTDYQNNNSVVTINLAPNTIYKLNNNVTSLTVNTNNIYSNTNSYETIVYFRTGSTEGTVTVTGNVEVPVYGNLELNKNTEYTLNYKDNIIVVTPLNNLTLLQETSYNTSDNTTNIGAVRGMFYIDTTSTQKMLYLCLGEGVNGSGTWAKISLTDVVTSTVATNNS